MKYYILLTVFLFGSFFVVQHILAASDDIVINEIGAYPVGEHEWIEIWNRGGDPIDIKDWKLWENNASHSLHAATSSDSIVSPGEYAVICQSTTSFFMDYPNFIGSVFDSSWVNLSEGGEEIGLKNGVGNFVEQFSYVSSSKYSLERKNPFLNDYSINNWQENNGGNTVGFQNSNFLVADNFVVSSTETTTSLNNVEKTADQVASTTLENSTSTTTDTFGWNFIKLNEVVSDPTNGNESVELFNTDSSTLDVTDGLICDSSGADCKLLNGLMAGRDWLVVDLLSDRYLNNSGDSVTLRDKNNNIIDSLVYGTANLAAPDKGQSLVRKNDGLDNDLDSDWSVTNKITLGTSNEVVLPVHSNNIYSGNSVVHNNNNNFSSATSSSKIIKISTTTKTAVEPKDPVNINWKLDWPYGLDIGEMGIFSAKGSADPRGGEVSFVWNFGDNSSGTGHLFGHVFASSGVYAVSITASSSAGTVSKKEFKVHVGSNFSVNNSDIKIGDWLVTSTEDLPEYIELKNNLNKPQNISGWKIKNKSGKEYELPDNTIIAASGTLKFFRSIHHLSFEKTGDEIRLTSPNDKEVDKMVLAIEKKKDKEAKALSVKSFSNWRSLRGVVTAEPKTFGQQFFYVSDGQSGFQVYQYKKDFPDLKIGDYVAVGGEMSDIDGVSRIKIKNKYAIDILETNKTIEPLDLKLEDLEDGQVGSLVKIVGDITEIKNNLMYVDDGDMEIIIYFKKGAKINKQTLKEGDRIEVVGILNKNKDDWQVWPRFSEDIKIIGHADEVLDNRVAADQNKQNEVAKKYLATTAGGLTALLLGFLAKARGALLMAGAKKVVGMASNFIKRG